MSGHRKWADIRNERMNRSNVDLTRLRELVNQLKAGIAEGDYGQPVDDVRDSIVAEACHLIEQDDERRAALAARRDEARDAREAELAAWYDTHDAVTGELLPPEQWAHGSVPPESREAYEDASEEAAAREVYREDC